MTSGHLPAVGVAAPVLIGWVDESHRAANGGHYVLAAVVTEAAVVEEARRRARDVRLKGSRYFHWRAERPEPRRRMLHQIVELDLALVVVVTTPVDGRRQQRARALCLKRLVWELAERGVRRVVLESRGDMDVSDRKILGGLRRAGVIPADLAYEFATKREPALWMPDAIAGAVGRP
jgi:hypothetical protein